VSSVSSCLLGGLLLCGRDIGQWLDLLDAEHFWLAEDQSLFNQICKDFAAFGHVSPGTRNDHSQHVIDAGDAGFVESEIRSWLSTFFEESARNRLLFVAEDMAAAATSKDLTALESCIERGAGIVAARAVSLVGQEWHGPKLDNEWDAMKEMERTAQRVLFGIEGLDSRLGGGLLPGELCIVAARTGIGKSSLLYQVAALAALKMQLPTFFLSLEIHPCRVVERIASTYFQEGQPGKEHIQQACSAPLYIDNKTRTIEGLRAQVRRLCGQRHIQVVLVDYLQLMGAKKETSNRVQELSVITRTLKLLAQDFNLVVIAAAQINRASISEGGAPNLHHLRDSGTIEQDSDQVLVIHRPRPSSHEAAIYIRKNRRGAIDKVDCKWKPATQTFGDLVTFGKKMEQTWLSS